MPCMSVLCACMSQYVLGAGAGAQRRRAKPEDPAGEVSWRAGRALALAAAIRALVSQQARWW